MRWYNLTMSTDNAVFRVGDAVVYPLQGVGSIISCEKRREREYYRIGIAASYSATKRYQWCYLSAIEQLAHTQGVKLTITDIRPGFVRTPLLDDGNHYPMQLTADYTARAICRAINRRRRVVVINWLYAVLVFFWRLIPRVVWRRMVLSTKHG